MWPFAKKAPPKCWSCGSTDKLAFEGLCEPCACEAAHQRWEASRKAEADKRHKEDLRMQRNAEIGAMKALIDAGLIQEEPK